MKEGTKIFLLYCYNPDTWFDDLIGLYSSKELVEQGRDWYKSMKPSLELWIDCQCLDVELPTEED